MAVIEFFTFFLHLLILWALTGAKQHSGGQKTFRSHFVPFCPVNSCVKLSCQAWSQSPLPAEPSPKSLQHMALKTVIICFCYSYICKQRILKKNILHSFGQ